MPFETPAWCERGFLVFEAKAPPPEKLCHVDRRRSWMNILLQSEYDWPVCLPRDRIEPCEGALGDFCYVRHQTSSLFTADDLVKCMPLRGSGWYRQSVVQTCMHFGVLQPSDITHAEDSDGVIRDR